MSELRKALVLQLSDSEREELEAICHKYNFNSDKLMVALLNGLKSGKVALAHDEEEGWIVSSKEQTDTEQFENELSLNAKIPEPESESELEPESELELEWSLTSNIKTKKEPKDIKHDLVNILALAESGYEFGVSYIDLKSIFDNDGDYEEEFEDATDGLYDLAHKVLKVKN